MKSEKTGLIGHPLGHSCSPRLHELLGGYGYALWDTAPEELDALLQAGVLADEALVSYEHSADANDAVDSALAAREPLFSLDSRRTYGDTVIDIFTIG